MNRRMATAILQYRAAVDAKRLALLRKLDTLDKELFSTGYHKLSRAVQACQEYAKFIGDPAPELIYFVLGAIEFVRLAL